MSDRDFKITATYPTIRECAEGEIVIQLQDLLVKAGSNIEINGHFNLGTRNAVRAFQRKYGLPINGVVDGQTWIKLLEVSGNIKFSNTEKEVLIGFMQIPGVPESEARELMKKYPNARWAITGIIKS